MADISQIKAPDGSVYNLKDSAAMIYPYARTLESRTYTNVIATSNDNRGAGFFYMKVVGTTFNTRWHVKVRVRATVPGYELYNTDSIFDLWATQNTYCGYYCLNKVLSGSYRPIYYHSYFRPTSTGYTNGCGGWIGVNLYASSNPTNASYKRTITVDLLEYEDCAVTFVDTLITPDNIPNQSAHTNWYYSSNTSYDNFDACTNGIKSSGDANTTTISLLHHGASYYVADSYVGRYSMLFQVDENRLTPLNNVENGYNNTSKAMLTSVDFNPFGEILYWYSSGTVAAGGSMAGSNTYYAHNSIDLRYTFNCTTSTFTANKPLYLVVTENGDGTCHLTSSTPWSNTLPSTDDGNLYIFLGRTVNGYQLAMYPEHPVYYHDGTKVMRKMPGHSVEKDVPASAAFTDTTNADGVSGASINRFAMCSTAANVESKVADIDSGSLTLEDGARVTVFFTNPNTTSMPTLNVNDTGAKRVLIGTHDSTTSLVLVDGQENLLSGACDFVYSDSYGAWVLMSSGATARNEVVYSQTAPTNALKGTLWVKPAQSTVAETKCLVITASGVSSLPLVINNGNITSDMVVIGHEFSNRLAMVGDIAWTTANGSVTLSGTIDGSTNVVLYLLRSR